MTRFAAFLLIAAVAGCLRPAPEQTAATAKPAATPVKVTPVIAGGWPAVFADAPGSVALFARLGFRPGAYARDGAVHRAVAEPTPMSDVSQQPADVANFVATGDAGRLDRVALSLDLVSKADQATSRTQFRRWVGQALSQLGVAGADRVLPAIDAGKAESGDVAGAHYDVAERAIDGGRRLVVTFSRPEGNPGTTEPRNG